MPVIDALPTSYRASRAALGLIVIDMQRDFIEPGGFGASLSNDVRPLARLISRQTPPAYLGVAYDRGDRAR